jgi:hypothetical protein
MFGYLPNRNLACSIARRLPMATGWRAATALAVLAAAAGCSASDGEAVSASARAALHADSLRVTGRVSRAVTARRDRGLSSVSLESAMPSQNVPTGIAGNASALRDEECKRPFAIAPHPRFPLVVNQGGSVVAKPVITSVSFDNAYGIDVDILDAFVEELGEQPFWAATTKEYGVGRPKVRHPAHLHEAAPATIDDSAIHAWLAAKIAAGDSQLGTPSASTLYVLNYPSTTTVTLSSGGQVVATSCVEFAGYHGFAPVTVAGSTVFVPYAVIPECLSSSDAGASKMLDDVTGTTSHELVEAVTDPYVNAEGNPNLPSTLRTAFSGTALHTADFDPYAIWAYADSGKLNFPELADMCELFGSSYFTPAKFPFQVQRSWSNKAARESHDPCAPNRTDERHFFAAVPVFDPDFAINEAKDPPVYLPAVEITDTSSSPPTTFQTQGLKIPVGGSATIPVNLFSDGPVQDWTVAAFDETFNPPATPNLTFTWDKTQGNNGDVLYLTIHVVAVDAAIGGNAFRITSTDGTIAHSFYGYIGQN